MRLKSLSLNGYKTFANKQKFEFGDGITCIIGPNGSGKSNVADSIRWALGEQSFSLLRGKRTDDMIFSGSAKRARGSMAEVVMTFDNSDGFFPIAFNDIEIGRRAFRDGANEYILNNNRVRLRDVSDLLGHSGLAERTYTVIGQGLVDNALAQKPEERRALFEEAAGIASYRDRREDALRKLEETKHNLERAQDILTEITPRLGQLERQASRARQYQVLKTELDELTKTYFGFYYRRVLNAIREATEQRDKARQAANEAMSAVSQLDDEANAQRQARGDLRAKLNEFTPKRDEARRASEASQRNVAVMSERITATQRQIADMDADVQHSVAQLDQFLQSAIEAAAGFATAKTAFDARQTELQLAQSSVSDQTAERNRLEGERNNAQQKLIDLRANISAAQKQADSLNARQEQLQTELLALNKRANELGQQRDEASARFHELAQNIERDSTQTSLFDVRFDDAATLLEEARVSLATSQSSLAAAEAEDKLTERFSLFAEMRAQHTADLAQAALDNQLPHVLGTLQQFIQVLPEDQKAVEAALGDTLHALVIDVQREGDTLNSIRSWLTEQPTGRLAIVMPKALRALDEDRLAQDLALSSHAQSKGARALLDSIIAPEWLQPALQLIAGGAFIARDLQEARELALSLVDGCVVVTRDGEIAYPIGTLSLPAGARRPMILGEEATSFSQDKEFLTTLDAETRKANLQKAQQECESAQQRFDAARIAHDEAIRSREIFAKENVSRKNALDDAQRKLERMEENLAALAGEIAQTENEIEANAQLIEQLAESIRSHESEQILAHQKADDFEAMLMTHLSGGWSETVNLAQNQLSIAQAALRNSELMLQDRNRAHEAAIAERDARMGRLAHLQTQHRHSTAELDQLVAQSAESENALREIESALEPIQQHISEIEQKLIELDERKRDRDKILREHETRLNQFSLELGRHEDQLGNMRTRAMEMIVEDVGAGELAASSEQISVDAYLESLPLVESLPDGLEDRVHQLRGQVKRLGAINYEAQVEYEELKKRHDFITTQSEDLTKATESLRQVIAELNDVIKVTFRQTFDAIDAAFQNTFKVLFGGGQAKLTLTNPDNVDECGVEIQAQPPGKRPQSLALLSGGERSLTATSLLFAILQVKPTPFCVLDEVDAALDESNVGRFRAMLESLSDNTQFIIITHNRRTVEAASTIYGISMGADGASTCLSLRLDEVK
jgi:chromosome segregation protein